MLVIQIGKDGKGLQEIFLLEVEKKLILRRFSMGVLHSCTCEQRYWLPCARLSVQGRLHRKQP